jgi:DNA-binding LytR/AlgR family response regulator
VGTLNLSVMAVDADPPALAALVTLLAHDPRVATVRSADSAVAALRLVRRHPVDAAFLDVSGDAAGAEMTGLELGLLLSRLATPPALVFVAETGGQALEAYDLGALDYLVKPVHAARIARSLGRVHAWPGYEGPGYDGPSRYDGAGHEGPSRYDGPGYGGPGGDLATLPVEVDGRTVLVHRDDVRFVEARGDYVRLHTDRGTHLFRIPLSRLALHWARAGFVRVHRGYLVSLRHVHELREDPLGGVLVSVAAGGATRELPVSRRHVRTVKDRLTGLGRPR